MSLSTDLIKNPRKLFIIDGIGALVSAFLLGIILVRFENLLGIPASTLYVLASFPILFAIYDVYAYSKAKNVSCFLRGIAVMNLSYCLLSIGLTLFHHEIITIYGWAYMIVEVVLVGVLAFIQFRVARKLIKHTL